MIRLLLGLFRPLRSIDASLKQLVALYRLDLRTRGVEEIDTGLRDEVEVVYGEVSEDDVFAREGR